MPSITPASATELKLVSRDGEAHRMDSFRRRMNRDALKLHFVVFGLKEIVLNGNAISAVHPILVDG